MINIIKREKLYVLWALFTTLALFMPGGSQIIPQEVWNMAGNNVLLKGVLCIRYSLESFDMWIIPLLVVLYYGYQYIDRKCLIEKKRTIWILSGIISFVLLLCESYHKINSWDLIFGGFRAGGVALVRWIGFSCLIYACFAYMSTITIELQDSNVIDNVKKKHVTIIKIMLMLIFCWLPYIITLFPGCFSSDAQDQIAQALNNREFCWTEKTINLLDESVILNNHHPVLYTVMLKGVLNLGRVINSYEWAFELFCILQCFIMAYVIAYLLWTIKEKNIKNAYYKIVFSFFLFNPLFPCYGMTVVKDTLFACAFVLYVVFLYEFVEHNLVGDYRKIILKLWFCALFLMLIRNNGIYILGVLLVAMFVYYRKNKRMIKLTIIAVLIPILVCKIGVSQLLFPALNITEGSKRELFSVPFQQTARYISEYGNEIDEKDSEVICKVLMEDGNINKISNNYEPTVADKVKNTYNKDCSTRDLIEYFKLWSKNFLKHPKVYIEAFLNLNYGWFSYYCSHDNIVYSEADELNLPQLVPGFDGAGGNRTVRELIFHGVWCMAEIPLTSWLVELSFYSWLYVLLLVYMVRKKKKKAILVSSMIYTNYLICFVGPMTYLRYALPMIMVAPFIVFIALIERGTEDKEVVSAFDEMGSV